MGSEGQTKGKLFPAHPQEGRTAEPAVQQEGLSGLGGEAAIPPSCARQSIPRACGALSISQREEKGKGGKGQVHELLLQLKVSESLYHFLICGS